MTVDAQVKQDTQGLAPAAQVVVQPAYSIAGFCRAFSIGRTAAFAELKAGRLRRTRVGRRTIIAAQDALAWLDSHREASAGLPARPSRGGRKPRRAAG